MLLVAESCWPTMISSENPKTIIKPSGFTVMISPRRSIFALVERDNRQLRTGDL